MKCADSHAAARQLIEDRRWMQLALRLARKGYGWTSPNPMVGAVLVKNGRLIGQGWHHKAGMPHAEIDAMNDARRRGHSIKGATLYVTLEPCSTTGRTPPCTEAIISSGIARVVAATTDPNPAHSGRGFDILRKHGILVSTNLLSETAAELNEAFNHWILNRTPWVIIKAAMTLDGKIATASGQSRWITGPKARAFGMRLRLGADAILVGVNTILADNPSLTVRKKGSDTPIKPLRRIILDSHARTPLTARVISDAHAAWTTVIVTQAAPARRVVQLAKKVNVLVAPAKNGRVDLKWLLKTLGAGQITSLLVEGGGEVNASFLQERLGNRLFFFYAPKIIGGHGSVTPLAVAGNGARTLQEVPTLKDCRWRRLGDDLMLTARSA
jgi:diaminohydroxyphosphoribosylaminopyrimidine deaminase/5-amino-6-(5-phosphoribosylamino)uracil reductase